MTTTSRPRLSGVPTAKKALLLEADEKFAALSKKQKKIATKILGGLDLKKDSGGVTRGSTPIPTSTPVEVRDAIVASLNADLAEMDYNPLPKGRGRAFVNNGLDGWDLIVQVRK